MKPYKEYTSVRLSHLLRYCSVGAIMRSSEFLVTVKDTTYWTDAHGKYAGRIIPYVEQVKQSLGITDVELREPPIGSLDNDGNFDYDSGHYIQAQIFPSWFVCSNIKCGRLHSKPYQSEQLGLFNDTTNKKYELKCQSCQAKLDQVNLVQVDKRGYLSDVPFYRIAHHNKRFCDWRTHFLKWNVKNNEVSCSCGAKDKFSLSEPRFYQGFEQPWSNKKVDEKVLENDIKSKTSPTANIMEVNDTRVHTPVNVSALVIPPESRIAKGTLTDKLYRHPKRELLISLRQDGQDSSELERELRAVFECDKTAFADALTDIENGYPLFSGELQEKDLAESEYEALTTPLDFDDDEDFVTRHFSDEFVALLDGVSEPLSQKIGRLIDQVVAVNKLKEILVSKGFTRGGADMDANEKSEAMQSSNTDGHDGDNHEKEQTDRTIPPDLGNNIGWLPALELYGEGIFITLSDEILRRWENDPKVIARCNILAERYFNSHFAKQFEQTLMLSPRFLLLHAFSHLFIKELESLAGYPAASLREKIYSSSSLDSPMAGILIYTVIADVDGTLGGLVELSEPKRLLKVLTRVVERMQWCSLDPVCGGHTGQGPALLNLSACHGCLLLPETSCMCGNILLDRMILKGSNEVPSILNFV